LPVIGTAKIVLGTAPALPFIRTAKEATVTASLCLLKEQLRELQEELSQKNNLLLLL
jgi:hypothetical protein